MRRSRANRTDGNQKSIVKALEAIGCSVTDTSNVGNGFPDLAAGYRGRTFLIECKNGDLPPSKRKLTADQEKWHATWCGSAFVVESAQDAVSMILGDEP